MITEWTNKTIGEKYNTFVMVQVVEDNLKRFTTQKVRDATSFQRLYNISGRSLYLVSLLQKVGDERYFISKVSNMQEHMWSHDLE